MEHIKICRRFLLTRDKTSFLATDYMKYGDIIGELALSLRREGSNKKLVGLRSVFRYTKTVYFEILLSLSFINRRIIGRYILLCTDGVVK